MADVRHKRGTRAALNALAGGNGLLPGQIYAITDEARIAVALTASTYQAFMKEGEPAGGDPWNYVRLTADFSTSSATAVDAGLGFTPAAGTEYEFEALLYTRTATTTVGPRPGLAWATGLTDGVVSIAQPSSATAQLLAFGNSAAAVLAAVGGLPNTTQSWPARITGGVRAGASPSGQVRVQLASETAGTNVTVKAGSWLKYRVVP